MLLTAAQPTSLIGPCCSYKGTPNTGPARLQLYRFQTERVRMHKPNVPHVYFEWVRSALVSLACCCVLCGGSESGVPAVCYGCLCCLYVRPCDTRIALARSCRE